MKGKYAAKAANRAVALDNEVIAELREQLVAVISDRDAKARELDALRREFNGQLLTEIDWRTEDARKSLAAQRAEDQAASKDAMDTAADRVATVLSDVFSSLIAQFGASTAVFPATVFSDVDGLPSVFRLLAKDRAGELLEQCINRDGSINSGTAGEARNRKRRSAHKLENDIRQNKQRFAEKRDLLKKIQKKTAAADEQET